LEILSTLLQTGNLTGAAQCWDINENGVCDLILEDINNDGNCTVLDCQGKQGPFGTNGTHGRHCWDIDADNVCDLLTEDKNSDGSCDHLDCQGTNGTSGTHCWDLNANHQCDLVTEDKNVDGICNTLDCQGIAGGNGTSGADGSHGLHCWDLNENRVCDIATEDLNKDGNCTVADCTHYANGTIDLSKAEGPQIDMRYQFDAPTQTRLQLDGAGELGIYTRNGQSGTLSRAMTVSNAQHVGIGTNTPAYPLHIEDKSAAYTQMRAFCTNTSSKAGISVFHEDAASDMVLQHSSDGSGMLHNRGGPLYMAGQSIHMYSTDQSPNEAIHIAADGTVGIRTSHSGNPSFQIEMQGNTQVLGQLQSGSHLSVNGDITVTGAVDGVDVAAFKSDYDGKVNQDVKSGASPTFHTPQCTNLNVYSGSGAGWQGRTTTGSADGRVVMGNYGGQIWLGGHTGPLSAWQDIYIQPAGGEYVKIGATTAPTEVLDVTGNILASGNLVATQLKLDESAAPSSANIETGKQQLYLDSGNGNRLTRMASDGVTTVIEHDAPYTEYIASDATVSASVDMDIPSFVFTDITPAVGWAEYTTITGAPFQCTQTYDGLVLLRGLLHNTDGGASSTVATLPSRCWPKYGVYREWVESAQGQPCLLHISTTGVITAEASCYSTLFFDVASLTMLAATRESTTVPGYLTIPGEAVKRVDVDVPDPVFYPFTLTDSSNMLADTAISGPFGAWKSQSGVVIWTGRVDVHAAASTAAVSTQFSIPVEVAPSYKLRLFISRATIQSGDCYIDVFAAPDTRVDGLYVCFTQSTSVPLRRVRYFMHTTPLSYTMTYLGNTITLPVTATSQLSITYNSPWVLFSTGVGFGVGLSTTNTPQGFVLTNSFFQTSGAVETHVATLPTTLTPDYNYYFKASGSSKTLDCMMYTATSGEVTVTEADGATACYGLTGWASMHMAYFIDSVNPSVLPASLAYNWPSVSAPIEVAKSSISIIHATPLSSATVPTPPTGDQHVFLDSSNNNRLSLMDSSRTVTPTGDVSGPGPVTDDSIPRFDGTTGKILQSSGITVDDNDHLRTAGMITVDARPHGVSGTGITIISSINIPSPVSTTAHGALRIQDITGAQTLVLDANQIETEGTPFFINHRANSAGQYQNVFIAGNGGGTGKVGIGATVAIDAKLNVNSDDEAQLKLSHDIDDLCTFTVSSTGDLTVDPSGGDVVIDDSLGIGMHPGAYQLQLSTDNAGKPSTNTWTITSDSRIKTNIEDANIDECLDKIRGVRLREFNYHPAYAGQHKLDKDKKKLGVVAQELEQVAPNCIRTHQGTTTFASEGEKLEIHELKTVNVDELNYAMYGAIQKLSQMVEALQQKVAQMEATATSE
jgi:Chaperone of endosialidase